jgi:hypothetical protein
LPRVVGPNGVRYLNYRRIPKLGHKNAKTMSDKKQSGGDSPLYDKHLT